MNEAALGTGGLDRATLTPVVRRVLGDHAAEVVGWQTHELQGGMATNWMGGGVVRVAGLARSRGRLAPWSVVLKLASPPKEEGDDDPTGWRYWQRELLAYQSGLLGSLPAGIRAPAYYGGGVDRARQPWLWLEDVADEAEPDWTDEHYARAARHLGQFNGAYLVGRPLPDQRWLCSSPVERRIDSSVRPVVRDFGVLRHHASVRQLLPDSLPERLLRLWTEYNRWLAALARLPRTFCHMDAVRRNLLTRRGADGSWQTVAVDWTFAGLAGVGQDLGTLVAGGMFFCELDLPRARRLDEIVFEGYMAGLRDAGWTGDPRLARLGYAGGIALWHGLLAFHLAPIFANLTEGWREASERTMGRPFPEIVACWSEWLRFCLDLADEARALLPAVERRAAA